jgi:hypothetical protein
MSVWFLVGREIIDEIHKNNFSKKTLLFSDLANFNKILRETPSLSQRGRQPKGSTP